MFRYAIPGMICLVAAGGVTFAQQSPNRLEPLTPPLEAAPAAPPDVSETMEEAMPGDHWTYETRDEVTGEVKATTTNVVIEVTATAISLRFSILGNPNSGYITYDRSWNVINNGTWKYAPNDGTGVRLPLSVGKTWTFQSADSYSTQGLNFKRTGNSKVTGREIITTSAGTFDTFKLETSYSMRNANDPTKKFDFKLLTWYAPAINHWVKRVSTSRSTGQLRDNSSMELVEFGRK
jgi:hypothetical protein